MNARIGYRVVILLIIKLVKGRGLSGEGFPVFIAFAEVYRYWAVAKIGENKLWSLAVSMKSKCGRHFN